MVTDKYRGIRIALKLAKLTGGSVNVALNNDGKPVKIEGKIKKVHWQTFLIRLQSGQLSTVGIPKVEYVEFS